MGISTFYGFGTKRSGVETLAAARTLKEGDSGKLFLLNATEGAQIVLPSPKRGLGFRFLTAGAFGTTAWTLTTSTNIIQGSLIVGGASVPLEDENTITFVATSETLGDYVELLSDGTNYYANGIGAGEGALTGTQE
jgi:hypothetical protein